MPALADARRIVSGNAGGRVYFLSLEEPTARPLPLRCQKRYSAMPLGYPSESRRMEEIHTDAYPVLLRAARLSRLIEQTVSSKPFASAHQAE